MGPFAFLLLATTSTLVLGGGRQPSRSASFDTFVQLRTTNGKCGGEAVLADGQTVKIEGGRRTWKNRMCAWSVSSTDPGTNFEVRCPVFDLPWSEGCKRSRLMVGDGTGNSDTLCGRGGKHLFLKSNRMWVSYLHRRRGKAKGFQCTVTAVRGNKIAALTHGAVIPKLPALADEQLKKKAADFRSEPSPWTTCECGIRGNGSLEYPWLASIKLNYDDGTSGFGVTTLYSYCSAAVINSRYLLTAAKCVTGENGLPIAAEALEVGLGNYDVPIDGLVGTEQVFQVEEVIIHPNYSDLQVDIALLKIPKELNITKYTPVCLVSDPNESLVGKTGLMIGLDYLTGLWDQEVPIVSSTECEDPEKLCARFPGNGMSICLGDMGGPLLVERETKFFQAGIALYGYDCELVGTERPYTNVALYYQWIISNTADALYCEENTLL
ncbi:trypsin-3-like [Penaeus indicus]|uniref:trypsin-3-like n=1 Tax=Penaeus indicus TaxID=29960 RepID=UPI00300C0AC7